MIGKQMFTKQTEKTALSRVLSVCRAAYAAIGKGEQELNSVALLDSLSAALSHVGHAQQPLSRCMSSLKREIKAAGKPFYHSVRRCFSVFFPAQELDFEAALPHLPALIYGNDRICAALINGGQDKARSMADAMKSYPGYLFGEFEMLTPQQFYDLVFGYYPKLYDEPFMDEMKHLFEDC